MKPALDPNHKYSSWAIVDLEAIRHNVRSILEHTGVQVMAIVKANAYGHGAVPVARAALDAGASWCAVARADEALELRRAGLDCPVLLLGYTPEGRFEELIANGVSMTVWRSGQVETLSKYAGNIGKDARLHLKVDTGMSRLGVQPGDALNLSRMLADTSRVQFEGIFTHFARADEADRTATELQEQRFQDVLSKLEANALRPSLVHASNSAASLTRSSVHFNMVRFGISMYGLHPSPECPLPETYRPALTWKSCLSQVKVLPAGRGVSYGHEYTTKADERIGTIPVGYGDGYRRTVGNSVLVGGKKVPVVGRVCMDQIMVQLDAVPDAAERDEVVLIGKQGGASITAEEVAGVWGTINYEVTCDINSRVPRFYT